MTWSDSTGKHHWGLRRNVSILEYGTEAKAINPEGTFLFAQTLSGKFSLLHVCFVVFCFFWFVLLTLKGKMLLLLLLECSAHTPFMHLLINWNDFTDMGGWREECARGVRNGVRDIPA